MSQNNTPRDRLDARIRGDEHTPQSPPIDQRGTFMGHPTGLFLLFLVEMWERFSYYGMRGLLVLYLTAVLAPMQLPVGVYQNTLTLRESAGDNAPAVQRTRPIYVSVGQPVADGTAEWATEGNATLQLQRLVPSPDPNDPNKTIWSPAEGPETPLVFAGERGRPFPNPEARFQISNPTDTTVTLTVGVEPDPNDKRTYVTINDEPGLVVLEIKPDAARAAAEKPEEPAQLVVKINNHDSGRNWSDKVASTAYGWYTGLAYLLPIIGGLIADKLIGTHRSMVVGGLAIALGHVALAISGLGELALNQTGMTIFIFGLALIVVGTGHFKPSVSVMVGQLYPPGDPRRDSAFSIFYMGINLGAFLCNIVCGYLAYAYGWHYGFGAAAVGMIAGLLLYLAFRPAYLQGIGEAPEGKGGSAPLFFIGAIAVSAAFAALYHIGAIGALWSAVGTVFENDTAKWAVPVGMLLVILGFCAWFVAINRPEDRGPVAAIFIFMFFNAFFWIAFEQAGTSINLFTDRQTDRTLTLFGRSYEIATPMFQSINPLIIIIGAPIFAWIWMFLGRRRMNPSQPVKIGLGLLLLAFGYVFMVWAARIALAPGVKASMLFIFMTYFWHTVGELCLSPTGLSFVTKVAPVRFVSLLMGIWFVSSFIANLGGGLLAGMVKDIEKGAIRLPWNLGGQADFFFLFVVTSGGAGILILVLTPLLKRLIAGREEGSQPPA